MTADYRYEQRILDVNIKEKTSRGGSYKETGSFPCPRILTSVSTPFYRHETIDYSDQFLLNSYFGKDHVFKAAYLGFGDDLNYRVHKLSFPVGKNNSFEPVYELKYQPVIAGKNQGSTHVKNSDGTSTVYHFLKKSFNDIY